MPVSPGLLLRSRCASQYSSAHWPGSVPGRVICFVTGREISYLKMCLIDSQLCNLSGSMPAWSCMGVDRLNLCPQGFDGERVGGGGGGGFLKAPA